MMGDGLGSASLLEAWVPSCPGLLPGLCAVWGSTILTHIPHSSGALPAHRRPNCSSTTPFCPGTLTPHYLAGTVNSLNG